MPLKRHFVMNHRYLIQIQNFCWSILSPSLPLPFHQSFLKLVWIQLNYISSDKKANSLVAWNWCSHSCHHDPDCVIHFDIAMSIPPQHFQWASNLDNMVPFIKESEENTRYITLTMMDPNEQFTAQYGPNAKNSPFPMLLHSTIEYFRGKINPTYGGIHCNLERCPGNPRICKFKVYSSMQG